jgi:hypothetical protein
MNHEANIHHITPGHLHAASYLPKGHSIRLLLAKASIDAYLHSEDFKFSNKIHEVPEFAADLLQELREALKSMEVGRKRTRTYYDSFSKKELPFLE